MSPSSRKLRAKASATCAKAGSETPLTRVFVEMSFMGFSSAISEVDGHAVGRRHAGEPGGGVEVTVGGGPVIDIADIAAPDRQAPGPVAGFHPGPQVHQGVGLGDEQRQV